MNIKHTIEYVIYVAKNLYHINHIRDFVVMHVEVKVKNYMFRVKYTVIHVQYVAINLKHIIKTLKLVVRFVVKFYIEIKWS